MSYILTAEEFVTLVLAKLKLKTQDEFLLETDAIDQLFEAAYNWLTSHRQEIKVIANFTFHCDPLYGVTPAFRDALLSLRERRMLQPDSSKKAYRISLSKELAEEFMKDSVIASDDLDKLVRAIFPKISGPSAA
jgi:hypothetical protein